MNFADIENVWRSPHNRPSPAQLENNKMELIADLKRRRRGFVLFSLLTLAALVVITGRFVGHLFAPDPGSDPIDFAREWAIVPLFALPWIGWVLLVVRHWRHHQRHANYTQSIHASLSALLDENRLERSRTKLIAWLIAAMLLIIPLIVHQLRVVGKAGDEILVPAFVVLPLVQACILLGMAWRYFRKLRPRQQQLEELLESYSTLQP